MGWGGGGGWVVRGGGVGGRVDRSDLPPGQNSLRAGRRHVTTECPMNCSKLPRWYRFPGCEVRGPIALVLLSCAGLSFASACVEGDTPGEPVFAPEVIGTASVPLSDNNEVVLLADGRVACVTESYDDRVHCVDLEGVVVGSFGREGRGPGEFGGAASLVRGDRGTIGVVDLELSRFSVFEPSGAFVSSVSLPGVAFSPIASFDTVLTGVSLRLVMPCGRRRLGAGRPVPAAGRRVGRLSPWKGELDPARQGTRARGPGTGCGGPGSAPRR